MATVNLNLVRVMSRWADRIDRRAREHFSRPSGASYAPIFVEIVVFALVLFVVLWMVGRAVKRRGPDTDREAGRRGV